MPSFDKFQRFPSFFFFSLLTEALGKTWPQDDVSLVLRSRDREGVLCILVAVVTMFVGWVPEASCALLSRKLCWSKIKPFPGKAPNSPRTTNGIAILRV